MSTPIDEALKKVLEGILLDWAMMFTEEADADSKNSESKWLHVEVKYQGDHDGAVHLWAPESLSRNLAVNIIGVDDPSQLDESEVRDALKELGNLACGHLMTSYYPDGVYSLKAPVCESVDQNLQDKSVLLIDGLPIYFNAIQEN